MINLYQGDCLQVLKTFPDNSIEAVVTDPPYGLSFMGKKWDYDVPSVEVWKEVIRVLKPGGHLLAFGGTRTYHRLVVAIEDAGFEIRDQVQWIYGQGFPKNLNITKAGGPPEFEGWGTALKPANEPICLARKPLEKGLTVAQNVQKWGTGGLNIDGCRIESPDADLTAVQNCKTEQSGDTVTLNVPGHSQPTYNPQGRFPANVIFDEEAGKMLDGSQGSPVSRFFYCAKASTSERSIGLTEGKNVHPTVKPIKLMEYLIKLITPPNGIVLDPFMGSGTTGIACKNLGVEFVGIEMNEDYFKIAEKRTA